MAFFMPSSIQQSVQSMESQILFLLFVSLSSIYHASAFTSTTVYFLNCGSSTNTTFSSESRTFVSDSQFLSSSSSSTSNTVSLINTINQQSNTLYNIARLFTQTSSYTFSTKTTGTHVLRLHFFPFTTQTHNLITSSNFNVSASQTFLLGSFSPASNKITIKEYYLWLDSDSLILIFTPNSPSLAFINAIELFTAPSSLINNTDPRTVSTSTAQDLNIGDLSHQSLESLYRVNVGGPLINPTNDTLWRTWLPDDPLFLFSNSLSKVTFTRKKIKYCRRPPLESVYSTVGKIKFSVSTPNFSSEEDSIDTGEIKYGPDPRSTREVAPEFIYSSVREMSISDSTRLGNPYFNLNLTWTFKVPVGYKYFIRMHFCDIVSVQALDLVFDVYIGYASAYKNLRLGSLTHQTLDTAFYVDFITDEGVVGNSGLLNVSVGRSSQSTPDIANAIMNGLEIMKINNSVGSLDGINSIALNTRKKSTHVVIASAAAATLVLIIMAITIVIFIRKRSIPAPAPLNPKANTTTTAVSCPPHHNDSINKSSSGTTPKIKMELELYIPLSDIKLATNEFEEALVIGHGGFGKVYKGVLSDGTMVAVKRAISRSRQGYPEFVNEINLLSKIRHRHLVSIIGYCDEMGEMILVYEFMEKGTLKNYLYGSPELPCLSWKQRLQICIEAARGLHYLHNAHSPVIIHRDVKSTNILLGQDFLAKISDFGISKLGHLLGEETYVSTGVKGSFGYFDPEYFTMLKLSTKSDVYSFGVVLLEVLCARPVIDPRFKDEDINLADWALHYLKKGKLEKIIDVRLTGEINPKSLEKFGEIAERCLAKHSDDRPTIGDVLWNLEYALQLQETMLTREPHEDSGTVETQTQSLSTDIDEDDNACD